LKGKKLIELDRARPVRFWSEVGDRGSVDPRSPSPSPSSGIRIADQKGNLDDLVTPVTRNGVT